MSILYKYHSSHSLNTNKVEGAQVSILYKYHSSPAVVLLIMTIVLGCRSFISIIVLLSNIAERLLKNRSVSILYKYHSSQLLYTQYRLSKDSVSILYKYHSSRRRRFEFRWKHRVSILYKYHSSLRLQKEIALKEQESVDPL